MLPASRTLRALFLVPTLLLVACGDGGSSGGNDSIVLDHFAYPAQLANPSSPYAAVLGSCVYRGTLPADELCTLARLPLIGQVTSTPTEDDVMDRVLVTDAWMATRLRQVLEALPPEALGLFRSLTAVVIARDIRPAYYTCYTGAIYVDPAYLWVTAEELATVSTDPDYRSAYGKDLEVDTRWRYTQDDAYAWSTVAPRTVEDITRALASLLYHELAHANDFLPVTSIPSLSRNSTVPDACNAGRGHWGSDRLYQWAPLTSQLLFGLARVQYGGATATAAQRAVTPEAFAAAFVQEGANDDYAYATHFEDYAMLLEETLTLYTLGIERDFAVTTRPAGTRPSNNEYIVAWGQRNRIADPLVRPRAKLVVQQVLPASEQQPVLDFLEGLPEPLQMVAGRGWLDNLDLGSDGAIGNGRAAGISGTAGFDDSRGRGGDLVLPPE